jgi:hypothetical protein
MELAIIIILTLSLGALLFSRIHFHFSFNLTISRSEKAIVRQQSGKARRENAALPKVEAPAVRHSLTEPATMANLADERTTERRGDPGVTSGFQSKSRLRSIRDSGVTSAIEAAKRSAEADLSSALINLGCRKEKAESVAKRAMVEGGKDFDSRLKWALANAA